MNLETLSQKKTFIIGLVVDCPMSDPLPDCPARDLRKVSLEEACKLIDDMMEAEVNDVLAFHIKCIRNRE